MSKAHYIRPSGPLKDALTVRLGAGTGSSNNLNNDLEKGKLVKLVATDRYDLCAAGDPIEGVISSITQATSGGYSIGGIQTQDMFFAIADGLQATPGTGTIAVGDYVVTGSVTAKGTALPNWPKVCKATNQPGTTPADLTAVGNQMKVAMFPWRVVSLGAVGTGAVGTEIVVALASDPI